MVVDDEAPARRYLRRLLTVHDDIDVIAEAASHVEAVQLIATLGPDAVFMDVELGDGDGLDLWAGLSSRPLVVFVTAHADRAPRAFDVEALDYLLKPVGAPRLAEAVLRLRRANQATQEHRQDKDQAAYSLATEKGRPIIIRSQGKTKLIRPENITAAVASGDYVELRTADGRTELTYITLTRLADQLPSPPFARVSRSLLLNLDHVDTIRPIPNAMMEVTFSTRAVPLELGRSAASHLRKLIVL